MSGVKEKGQVEERCRALVVDDNRANRRLVGVTLTVDGFEPEMAETVAEAERALEASRPDVALVDMSLPDAHGTDLVRWIRSRAETADLPVIAVSASARAEDVTRAMAAGCDYFLPKPINTRTFTRDVRDVMARRGQAVAS